MRWSVGPDPQGPHPCWPGKIGAFAPVVALMPRCRCRATVGVVGRVLLVDVFLVDDNAQFRSVARALLESGGYRVVGDAATGAEAVADVLRVQPDVVLLDIGLPDMDGFSVCRSLNRAAPQVRVVFCSARDAEHYGDSLTRSPAAGFLPKSMLSAEALARIVAGHHS